MGPVEQTYVSADLRPLRILIVTPSIPWPPNWGFGIRVSQFIQHLARSHRVSVLCYAQQGEDAKIAALAELCHSVHTVPSPLPTDRAKRRAQLLSLFRRQSFQSSSLRTDPLRTTASHLLLAERFDLVQIESSQMSGLPLKGVPYILDEHNLEYELLQRMYQTERSLIRKLYNWREYRKFRREEWKSWHEADACVVTSRRERAVLAQREPDKLIHVAPNGVDIDLFSPSTAAIDSESIVFTGLMNYRPNIDAALYFADQILPLVRRERPHAHFTVVGLGPPGEVRRLAGSHIHVTGEVPDVRPYIARAAVIVVPLRMGSGTRLKVMEGLAMEKGIVSTSVGCEGIDVRHGEHLLVADTEPAFANAVSLLMDEPHTRQRLARNGRRLVEDNYSWTSIARDLDRFYARVLESVRAGHRRSSKRSLATAQPETDQDVCH